MLAYDSAIALQAHLKKAAEAVAVEISRPIRARSEQACMRRWQEMAAHRPRLSSLYRALRKLETQSRKDLTLAGFRQQKEQQSEIKLLRQRLALWEPMERLVRRQANPKCIDLNYLRSATTSDAMLELFHDTLFRMANPNEQSAEAEAHGCFADIALDAAKFRNLMRVVYRILLAQGRAADARFLDVGCGGGTKLLAASLYFSAADGLDYEPAYVDAAQRLIEVGRLENSTAFHADGLTFEGYGEYDAIYLYRPMRDDENLVKLERQIFKHAKPGALIIAPYNGSNLSPRDDRLAAQVIGPIFLAGHSQASAERLAFEAQHTDTTLILRDRDFRFDTGFWSPIFEVATHNG